MQEVVNRILKGSITDAQYVLNESIETLQHAEYTTNYAILENTLRKDPKDENDIIFLALAKLVACSKELSLIFVSRTSLFTRAIYDRFLKSIVEIQKDEEVVNGVIHLLKNKISLLLGMQDFVMDNLDLFLRYSNDTYFFDEFSWMMQQMNYKIITDKQFLKICQVHLSTDVHIGHLTMDMLENVYIYGERTITIEKHMLHIIPKSANELFTLMQKYPSSINLLRTKMPNIRKNEAGIEHCVKLIENCIEYANKKDEERMKMPYFNYIPQKRPVMSLIRKFLDNFEDLSPFIHILADNFDDDGILKDVILDHYDKFGTGLPKVVDFVLKRLDDYCLIFLENACPFYENKEELRNKVIQRLENMESLNITQVYLVMFVSDGDLPINNRKVYNGCIKVLLENPGYVGYLSPKYAKVMIKHYIDQGIEDPLLEICSNGHVSQFDHMIVDLIIKSNRKSFLNKFWEIAISLQSKYAVEYAWIYGGLDIRDIEDAFYYNLLTTPDDDVVPKLIKQYLMRHEIPEGKLLAYLYNSTGCKIHINLIKSMFNIKTGKDSDSMAYQFLQMVETLNKIDHKEELRTILVYLVLINPGKFCYEDITRAIERLGGSDECHALVLYTC